MTEHYLGDGLYASFDGWQVVLRAPRETGDHVVAMEPEVIASLVNFLAHLNREHPSVPVWLAAMSAFHRCAQQEQEDKA